MTDKLSIRAYSSQINSHTHQHHQLVLPLHGVIELNIDGEPFVVGIGHCAIIQSGTTHSFKAREQASFLVADMQELPANVLTVDLPYVAIPNSLQAFCQFVEAQLEHKLNTELETAMMVLFRQLLEEEEFLPSYDQRIAKVLELLETDLSISHSLDELANKAHLSVSQFKTLFKSQTGQTCGQYLLKLRMEKARALLANTDFPAHRVAEQVGYQDQSAFSRRFSSFFGQTPSSFMRH